MLSILAAKLKGGLTYKLSLVSSLFVLFCFPATSNPTSSLISLTSVFSFVITEVVNPQFFLSLLDPVNFSSLRLISQMVDFPMLKDLERAIAIVGL